MTTKLNPATVEVDGKIYDAVPCGAGRCRDCVARLERELCDKLRDASPCVSNYRADDTDVHYVERKPDSEAWRQEYRDRQAKGEKFQRLDVSSEKWCNDSWEFTADKHLYRPKPVEPVFEAPAFDANRLLTDDEKRDDELIVLRAEVARLQAVNRIAIRHLDKVLKKGYDFDEHRGVVAEARDWLASIGGVA